MASYMGHEYTPAEQVQGRFRVGDRVRVVKDGDDNGGSYHGADIGSVDTIIAVDSDNGVPYEGKEWFYKNHEVSPAFRPGDRVKLNKHSGYRSYDERGTVSAVLGDNVSVRMDYASLYGTLVAAFPADVLDWERAEDAPVRAADCAVSKERPKFKAGDVVLNCAGSVYTIASVKTHYSDGRIYSGPLAYDYTNGDGFDWESSIQLVAPCPQDNEPSALPPWPISQPTSCIVALTKNGKPLPSRYPHVHASVADATQEAERLARNNPGEEFAVYQRVTARVASVTVEMKEVA